MTSPTPRTLPERLDAADQHDGALLALLLKHQWRSWPSPECGCGDPNWHGQWSTLPYPEAHARHLAEVLRYRA